MEDRLEAPKAIGKFLDAEKAKAVLARVVESGIAMNSRETSNTYQEFRYNFDSATDSNQKVTLLENKWGEIALQTYPSFKIFEEDTHIISKILIQTIARYVDGLDSELDPQKGVYLHGDYRIGKSILMRSMAYFSNYLQQTLEDKYPHPPTLSKYEESFFSECPEEVTKFLEANKGIFRGALLTSRMTYDEIGLEAIKISYMKNEMEFMGYILNQRNKLYVATLASNRIPLITNLIGNLNPKEFEARYGKRITLRMLEMCEPLEWIGNIKTGK